MSDDLESRGHHAITHDDETYIKLADASVTFGLYRKDIAAKDAKITRLRAEVATARRDGMEEAAKRLEELHKNHGYNSKTGEVRRHGKLVTCPLTIDHAIGYYRGLAEGIAHIRQRRCEGGEVMDWQPIETAPRDGTEILIWDEGDNGFGWVVARYETKEGWAAIGSTTDMMKVGRVRWHVAAQMYRGRYQLIKKPTYWMPLPAPPEDREP
jgi:hypothetical protein